MIHFKINLIQKHELTIFSEQLHYSKTKFEREMPGLCTPSSAAALRLFNAWLESQAAFCLSVSVNYLNIPKYGIGQETQGIYAHMNCVCVPHIKL